MFAILYLLISTFSSCNISVLFTKNAALPRKNLNTNKRTPISNNLYTSVSVCVGDRHKKWLKQFLKFKAIDVINTLIIIHQD